MTVYEQELRKLFEHSNLVDRPQFSGRVCVGDIGKDLRVRAEFLSTHISSQYDAIRLTVLNRTEGVVDRTLLRFQDVWGKKQVPNNPNFRSGVIPHLWDDYGKVEWYAYHPTAADYAALRDAVGQYLSAFRERTPELERSGPKLVYICAPLRCNKQRGVCAAESAGGVCGGKYPYLSASAVPACRRSHRSRPGRESQGDGTAPAGILSTDECVRSGLDGWDVAGDIQSR